MQNFCGFVVVYSYYEGGYKRGHTLSPGTDRFRINCTNFYAVNFKLGRSEFFRPVLPSASFLNSHLSNAKQETHAHSAKKELHRI